MKNKRTTIIFTDEPNIESAQAIKDYLASDLTNLTIIIGEDEFRSIPFKLVVERLFSEDGAVRRFADKTRNRISSMLIDKKPKDDIKFNSKKSTHIRAYNILIRYNPDLIILNDLSLIQDVIVARDKAMPDVPIAMVLSDYVLDLRIATNKINKFFVDNIAIKTTLVNNNIPEEKVVITDFPINPIIDKPTDKASLYSEFGFNVDKPLLLISTPPTDAAGIRQIFGILSQQKQFFNIVVDCGGDRNLLTHAHANDLVAINEGRSSFPLYEHASIVIGRPTSLAVAKTLYKGGLYFLLEARGEREARIANYLTEAGVVVPVYNVAALLACLKEFLDDSQAFDTIRAAIATHNQKRPRGTLFKNIELMLDMKALK
ncbi:MAG: hypothetical protein LBF12_07465 [Christensenellaceae bacterium]|jgi:UDP-N-acetylglucosamine:LPS N-acetylglucosamine transferase|nr:hypothetical protein [Christensenellaceae bacterium]